MTDAPLTADLAAELVRHTASAVEDGYVFADVGRSVAADLRQAADEGRYAASPHEAALAERVTGDLQAATGDLHLRLVHVPEGVSDEGDDAAYRAVWALQARETAGGVRSMERLDDGLAVLALGPVLCHPEHGGRQQRAALALVAEGSGLVLDLRECLGGTPESVALVCGALLGDEAVHLIDTESRRDGLRQHWTSPWEHPRRLQQSRPVVVLTSARTFSGGEEMAFDLQELGRATVVGERTKGGAHPRIGVRVSERMEAHIPVARAISPRTGRNWEGVGVAPDVEVVAARALEVGLEVLRGTRS